MELPEFEIGFFTGIRFKVVIVNDYEHEQEQLSGQLQGNIFRAVIPQTSIDSYQEDFSQTEGRWISDQETARVLAGYLFAFFIENLN